MSDLVLVRYADQLKHPRWQRRRLEILDRDGFACVRCGETEKQLHVHHRKYRAGAMAWDYEDHELETLCSDCHEIEHAKPSMFAAIPATIRADLSEAVRRGDLARATALTAEAFAAIRRNVDGDDHARQP